MLDWLEIVLNVVCSAGSLLMLGLGGVADARGEQAKAAKCYALASCLLVLRWR